MASLITTINKCFTSEFSFVLHTSLFWEPKYDKSESQYFCVYLRSECAMSVIFVLGLKQPTHNLVWMMMLQCACVYSIRFRYRHYFKPTQFLRTSEQVSKQASDWPRALTGIMLFHWKICKHSVHQGYDEIRDHII